jgi:hypothetical protein
MKYILSSSRGKVLRLLLLSVSNIELIGTVILDVVREEQYQYNFEDNDCI